MKRILAVLLAVLAAPIAAGATDVWPTHGHDLQHTGRSAYAVTGCALHWSYNSELYSSMFSNPVIDSAGSIYASVDDPWSLHAYNATGTFLWSYTPAGPIHASAALDPTGRVCFVSHDNNVYMLTSVGAFVWSYATGDDISLSSPAIDTAGRVYFGSQDNTFYCLTSVGAKAWTYVTGGDIRTSPALDSAGKVYFGSNDNLLYSLTSAGAVSWTYATGEDIFGSSPSIDSSGKVYAGSDDNRMYSFGSNGAFSWSYVCGGNVNSSASIASSGNRCFTSYDKRVYTLTSAGALSWSYQIATSYEYATTALGSDGTAYVGSSNFRMYAFNTSGGLAWSYQTDYELLWPAPSINASNEIVFGSNDGAIRVLGGPTATPTITPTATNTPTATPTATPTYCNTPMTITNGGGDANIPAPAATATDGWKVTFEGATVGGVFSTIYDHENVATPGAGTGPQPLKVTIQQVGEAIRIPAGYEIKYKDGDTWRSVYLPAITP